MKKTNKEYPRSCRSCKYSYGDYWSDSIFLKDMYSIADVSAILVIAGLVLIAIAFGD